MGERICPKCQAVAPPRLKFCRECGARLADAPRGGAAPPGDSGDRTVIGAAVRKPLPPTPSGPGDDGGDRTLLAGAGGAAGSGAEGTVEAGAGDATLIAGSVRDAGRGSAAGGRTETADAAGVPTASAPGPVPPPGSPPPAGDAYEEEPVGDDVDMGPRDDETGSTVAADLRAPPPTVDGIRAPSPPPPPAPTPSAPAPPRPAEETPTPAGVFRLEHWSPRVKQDFVALAGEETVVGRDRGDLRFPADNYLSRKHARFFRNGEGRLCVEDLGTLNGTYLRIRRPADLEHRDVVLLGRHVLRFELLHYDEQDDRTIEGDPLTRVQGVQGSPPRARLVKRQEEGFRGIPFFFGTRKYVLGRTEGTHRFTSDDRMSRRHASLSFLEGKFVLEDLGSQNGTYLRIAGPRLLEPGDVVLMGEQHFKVPG